jgi:hypothetical protein
LDGGRFDGNGRAPYGFHSSAKNLDITAEKMTRDDSPDRCIQLKGRVVVHTPAMDLYADELVPTAGCGGFVAHGDVRMKLLDGR